MWTTFATKAQKRLYMEFVCKFFLDVPIPASHKNYENWYSMFPTLIKTTFAHFIYRMRGSDASWEDNNEPPSQVF